jgi:CheY-like chemotaxis protein
MRQMTMLLVEDNPRDVRLIQRAFDKADIAHDLHIVRDGEEALAYLRRDGAYAEPNPAPRPDLILLDLNLPRMNGHEVLRQCKQDDRLKPIPIVVLTTSGYDDDVRKAYEAGANAYLLKPVEFARFTEIMRQLSAFWLALVELPPDAEA